MVFFALCVLIGLMTFASNQNNVIRRGVAYCIGNRRLAVGIYISRLRHSRQNVVDDVFRRLNARVVTGLLQTV